MKTKEERVRIARSMVLTDKTLYKSDNEIELRSPEKVLEVVTMLLRHCEEAEAEAQRAEFNLRTFKEMS